MHATAHVRDLAAAIAPQPNQIRPGRILALLREHKFDKVHSFIQQGSFDVATSVQGVPHLCVVIIDGDKSMVQFLLDHNANPQQEDNSGFNALRVAVIHGNYEIFKLVAGKSKEQDFKHLRETLTLLHDALVAWKNPWDADRVQILAELIKRVPLNEKDKNGLTPLHTAAEWGNLPAVKMICDAGADVNIVDYLFTPLGRAIKKGHADVVAYLLGLPQTDLSLHKFKDYLITALMLLESKSPTDSEQQEIIELLLQIVHKKTELDTQETRGFLEALRAKQTHRTQPTHEQQPTAPTTMLTSIGTSDTGTSMKIDFS